jgi:hypothetical protein
VDGCCKEKNVYTNLKQIAIYNPNSIFSRQKENPFFQQQQKSETLQIVSLILVEKIDVFPEFPPFFVFLSLTHRVQQICQFQSPRFHRISTKAFPDILFFASARTETAGLML